MVRSPLSNKNLFCALLAIAAAFILSSCAPYQARRAPSHYHAEGQASWYGPGFQGHRTASGERYDQRELTAAHKTLPFGYTIRVTNKDNGKSVIVRINDRGPFVHGRIIDLSRAAAEEIGMMGSGTAPVILATLTTASADERVENGEEELLSQGKGGKGKRSGKAETLAEEGPPPRNGVAYIISKQPKDAPQPIEQPKEEPEVTAKAPGSADDETF